MTYPEKLLDQRWQKKRLYLLESANWNCQCQCCQNPSEKPTLHVHHRIYIKGKEPWDYPDWAFQVLCSDCHVTEQELMREAYEALAKSPELLWACAAMLRCPDSYEAYRICSTLCSLLRCRPESFQHVASILEAVDNFKLKAFSAGYSVGESACAAAALDK